MKKNLHKNRRKINDIYQTKIEKRNRKEKNEKRSNYAIFVLNKNLKKFFD